MATENSSGNTPKKKVKPLNFQEMITIPVIIGAIALVLAKLLSFLF